MPKTGEPKKSEMPAAGEKMTVFVITEDWSGLHKMFDEGDFNSLAGVPLVPMLWKVLADKGHDVHVFVMGEFSSYEDAKMGGFTVHRLYRPGAVTGAVKGRTFRTMLKFGWFWAQIGFYRAVMKQAKLTPPDVLYSYRSGPAYVGHFLSRRLGCLHIGRRWGTWLGDVLFNGPWYRRIRAFGESFSYKIPYDLLIMSNDGTLGDKVAEYLGFPAEKHRFWLDGTARGIYQENIDKAAVKKSVGIKPTDKMIFGVARLDFWKRFDRAIDAMPTIIKRVPEARLVIAGDGPLRGKLEAQAERLGVKDYVKFLGGTAHEKVRALHNAADLFVTVQDLTNLGNQIMEAMHSGTCVVAYNVGGTTDVAKDGVNCVLVNESDLPRLGEIIADLLENDEKREKLAMGALDYAREHIWFWDERIDEEIKQVSDLVRQKRNA